MRKKWIIIIVLAIAITPFTLFSWANDSEHMKATEAYLKRDYKAARDHATAAIEAEPKREEPRMLLGMACSQLRDQAAAVKAFTGVIEINPNSLRAYDSRGDANLKLGKFKEAVADFDKVLAMKPEIAPEHWRRGIALYYTGQHAEGVKQFETHKRANPEDVENAAWHYLCNVKVVGKEKARADLIVVTRDSRVPMAEIQKLYAGKLQPADVMAAAEKIAADTDAGKEARFYANLYVALYYEAEGDAKKVVEHLTPAVQKYVISHYMWDIANVHLELLKAKK